MPRKRKEEHLVKGRYNITLPKSFHEWVNIGGNLSTRIQLLIAEDILGCTITQFRDALYPIQADMDSRQHKQDTLMQEMLRMARWMLEGEVITVVLSKDGTCAYLEVYWKLTKKTTWVYVDFDTTGFRKVIYDEVVDAPTDYENYSVFEYPSILVGGLDLSTPATKYQFILKWIRDSRSYR